MPSQEAHRRSPLVVSRRHPHRSGVRPPRAPSKALLLLCALLYLSAHKALQDVLEHAATLNSHLLTPSHSSPLRALSTVADHGLRRGGPPDHLRVVVATNHNATTAAASSSPFLYSNPHGVVHVVQTRFMQYQPHLTALAHARLELFRIFCLPLLLPRRGQGRQRIWESGSGGSATTQATSFLWTIRIDPDLDPTVVQRLIELLQSAGANDDLTNHHHASTTTAAARILIVASNDNPKFRQESPNATQLVWGDVNVWQSYFDAARTHTLLETRLDADDGLADGYLEQLQQRCATSNDVASGGGEGASSAVTPALVRVYCVDAHLEWHQPSQADSSNGTSSSAAGALVGVRTPHCVTPGLTVVSPPGVDDWAGVPAQHHVIHKRLPRCGRTVSSSSPSFSTFSASACYERFAHPDHWPMAIRARTVTSAGMSRVLLPLPRHHYHHHHNSHSDSHESPAAQTSPDHLQETAWRSLLPPLFGIHRDDVALVVRQYFNAGGHHIETGPDGNGTAASASLLAQQALEGQCTPGHSCKDGARQTLQAMVKAAAAAAQA